jgi:ABC-type bacteriocin/lantibiotic exporter with double-glycine peptidase domain
VPFFAQTEQQCGPAVLASVLNYWGHRITLDEAVGAVYQPKLKGALPLDLQLAALDRGFHAEVVTGTLDRLARSLERGRPPIVFLNLGWKLFPLGHFVVVTGIHAARREVTAHSGETPDLSIPYAEFLPGWEKTGNWMLLITPQKEAEP